jgi:cell division protein FtsN
MARRNPQTLAKRQREQAKREKRELKAQKKAAAAAARSEQSTDLEAASPTGKLIVIGTYGTRDEAEVVQGLLATAGIESWLQADDAGGAFPFVLSGEALVHVDESDAPMAAELLASRTDAT